MIGLDHDLWSPISGVRTPCPCPDVIVDHCDRTGWRILDHPMNDFASATCPRLGGIGVVQDCGERPIRLADGVVASSGCACFPGHFLSRRHHRA
jgi:hypothetical protein